MLNGMTMGTLQNFIAERGYADSFLYFGSKTTREIIAKVAFVDDEATDSYQFRLTHAVGDILVFTEEVLSHHLHADSEPDILQLDPAGRESDLPAYVHRTAGNTPNRQIAYGML
ncbi:MAG: hypothetical protein OHK0039_34560 [Bacteroidia bacterium]